MKAPSAITDGKGNFKIDEVEVGEPGPGEVLVDIKAAGVCHTDWRAGVEHCAYWRFECELCSNSARQTDKSILCLRPGSC